jgi:hypothetical protein
MEAEDMLLGYSGLMLKIAGVNSIFCRKYAPNVMYMAGG